MILAGEERPLSHKREQLVFVHRKRRRAVQHPGADPLFREQFARFDGASREVSHREDGDVSPVAQQVYRAVTELVALSVEWRAVLFQDHWQHAAPHREADVAGFREHPARRAVGLVRVGGNDDVPAEGVAEEADVVDALVRHAVLSDVKPRVGEHRLRAGAVDVVEPLLVIYFVAREDAEVGPHGDDPRGRRRAGGGRRRMLLDAGLHVIVGAGLREAVDLYRTGEVAVEYEHRRRALFFIVEFADLREGLAEGAAVVLLIFPCIGVRNAELKHRFFRRDAAAFGQGALALRERRVEHGDVAAKLLKRQLELFSLHVQCRL